MNLKTSTLSHVVELAMDGDKPPTEFRLFAMGSNHTSKGTYLFTAKSKQSCQAEYEKRGRADMPVDYNHAMNLPAFMMADPAQAGAAAGWFQLAMRTDGCWAENVRWTPRAMKMLADREYRFFSPTFEHATDGEVMNIVNCALTNMPATYGQQPLMAASQHPHHTPENPAMKNLITAALSMAADSVDETVTSRVMQLATFEGQVFAALGVAKPGEALGKVQGLMEVAKRATVLEAELSDLKGKTTATTVAALVAAAEVDGKAVPAQREFLTSMGMKDEGQLRAFLATAPRVVPVEKKEPAATVTPDGNTLSTEELAVAKLMGTDLKKLAELKAAGVHMRSATPLAAEKKTTNAA